MASSFLKHGLKSVKVVFSLGFSDARLFEQTGIAGESARHWIDSGVVDNVLGFQQNVVPHSGYFGVVLMYLVSLVESWTVPFEPSQVIVVHSLVIRLLVVLFNESPEHLGGTKSGLVGGILSPFVQPSQFFGCLRKCLLDFDVDKTDHVHAE